MNTTYAVGPALVFDQTGGQIAVQFATPRYCEGVYWYHLTHNGRPFPLDRQFGKEIFPNVRQINLTPLNNTFQAKITYFHGIIEFYRLEIVAGTIQEIVKL